jgi:hypothetical protein
MAMMVGAESSVEEVGEWLESLDGLEDVEMAVELFDDAGLNGSLLSTISAEELEALVGITDSGQVQLILAARDAAFAGGLLGSAEDVLRAAEGGAAPPAPPERKHPPMYRAVKRKDAALVLEMLKDGIDPNDPAEASPFTGAAALRRTPLQLSGLYRLPDIMAHLLEHGAAVNHTDGNGWSALHYAALNGDAQLARQLLAAGADASIATSQGGALGETPAEFARRHCQHAFADTVEGWTPGDAPEAAGASGGESASSGGGGEGGGEGGEGGRAAEDGDSGGEAEGAEPEPTSENG